MRSIIPSSSSVQREMFSNMPEIYDPLLKIPFSSAI
jgi:hypothetical protein